MTSKYEKPIRLAVNRSPDNPFVIAYLTFYNDRGYLTDKQIKALERVENRENKCGIITEVPEYWYDYDEHWYHD